MSPGSLEYASLADHSYDRRGDMGRHHRSALPRDPRHPESTLDEPLLIGRAGRASIVHLRDDQMFKVTLSASERVQ